MSEARIKAKHGAFVMTDDPTNYGLAPGGVTVVPRSDSFGNPPAATMKRPVVNIVDMSGGSPVVVKTVPSPDDPPTTAAQAQSSQSYTVPEVSFVAGDPVAITPTVVQPITTTPPGLVAPGTITLPWTPQPMTVTKEKIPDSLRMPFLGVEALKPTHRVVFDLGDSGQVSAFFHEVVIYSDFLILQYDTRYDGTQYLPPRSDKPIEVTVDGTSRFVVRSLDISFPLGCVDTTVLVVIPDEEPQLPENLTRMML